MREITTASILLRILLSLLLGGLLGLERGRKNRPAGFRTYMLVCLGAALVMMTNQYVYQNFATSDPVRMGAQVISGIGFLGAGTIIITSKNQVKGITTAASLWTAACSGLAIGIGFYEGAILGGIAIFFVMILMQGLADYIHKHAEVIDLYIELDDASSFTSFLQFARDNLFEISDVQLSKNKITRQSSACAIVSAKSVCKRVHSEMVDVLSRAPGVMFIEEI